MTRVVAGRRSARAAAGRRPAREREVKVLAPNCGKPTVRRRITATVPLRPDGSSCAVQDVSVALLAVAIRVAAAHGGPARPICSAAASAARSAARSSRCRASTAVPRSTVTMAAARITAPRPSTQIEAEPRSDRQLTRPDPARWRPPRFRPPPPMAASSPAAASSGQ
ncbi:MAG: hypothetical protein QOE23_1401 [Pseudonocardiales bacterium]|nr:hypothetical protein [Pseudonocardiales bacterium]